MTTEATEVSSTELAQAPTQDKKAPVQYGELTIGKHSSASQEDN